MFDPLAVEQVEVSDMRRPRPDEQRSDGCKIRGVFACRLGPIMIYGATLVSRVNGGPAIYLPAPRDAEKNIIVTDPDVRCAMKAAALRAYGLMLQEAGEATRG